MNGIRTRRQDSCRKGSLQRCPRIGRGWEGQPRPLFRLYSVFSGGTNFTSKHLFIWYAVLGCKLTTLVIVNLLPFTTRQQCYKTHLALHSITWRSNRLTKRRTITPRYKTYAKIFSYVQTGHVQLGWKSPKCLSSYCFGDVVFREFFRMHNNNNAINEQAKREEIQISNWDNFASLSL